MSGNETSGRNSAVVHGGFANPIGSLKAKCCVEGNKIMGQLAEELNFPFKRCGKVLVGNTPEDMEQLERTMKQGAVNGCTGLEMIDEAKLHELVPAVVGKFAMWSKKQRHHGPVPVHGGSGRERTRQQRGLLL